jgi:hypothetical protein
MVLYQICVFDADLKSNMAARVHNVFSLAEILKILNPVDMHTSIMCINILQNIKAAAPKL